ncbi:MAG: YifB family Mg chelatase-like AAA ATPase [Planctomycetota bacterium]
MLARVQSALLQGIDAQPCEVEVDFDEVGLDRQTIVGLPDAAVRESLERVRSALGNGGYAFPHGRVLINLAPADLRKEGPLYDLPIAVGLLLCQGLVPPASSGLDHRRYVFAGELALDGRLRPVPGCIAMAALAAERGFAGVVVPAENAREAAVVAGLEATRDRDEPFEVLGVRTLSEVACLLTGTMRPDPVPPIDVQGLLAQGESGLDFAEIKGQEPVKRAAVIAAAGSHNLLMLGPAGTGKTMIARALPGILPAMTPDEAIEVTRIYSAAGRLSSDDGLVRSRPVRTPHHTASSPAIVGGGAVPSPGEISLAHHGILFLDELPEFQRGVLETLRQPTEDHVVTISRASGSLNFPADFMLVAALNPTPRGDLAPGESGRREMDRYLSKISGPLLDRIDLHIEAPRVPWTDLADAPRGTASAEMRDRVAAARERQRARQGRVLNARLSGSTLDELAPLTDTARLLLRQAMTELGLSARAYDKVRRLSLTIADLDGADAVDAPQVAEAIQYRLLDRRP